MLIQKNFLLIRIFKSKIDHLLLDYFKFLFDIDTKTFNFYQFKILPYNSYEFGLSK